MRACEEAQMPWGGVPDARLVRALWTTRTGVGGKKRSAASGHDLLCHDFCQGWRGRALRYGATLQRWAAAARERPAKLLRLRGGGIESVCALIAPGILREKENWLPCSVHREPAAEETNPITMRQLRNVFVLTGRKVSQSTRIAIMAWLISIDGRIRTCW